MKDKEIIKLIKIGKTEKPIRFLYKEFPKIENNILVSGGDKEIARQIFHDSLILFIEKVEKKDFVASSKLTTFLFGINRFLWKNELRRRQKNIELEWADTLIVSAEDINYEIEKEIKLKTLDKILNQITEKCRTIFELFYFKKQTMQVIAEKLNFSSVNSAKTQKYKCLEKAIKMANEINVELNTIGK
ncbi:MAG: RNA polymerase sigma factor [Putridiphycobacter sp.]